MKKEYTCHIKEEQKLYKIGLFSQMNRITIKTLRYYDDIGLLKPAYVDETSGYRYYSSTQLPKLHRISALRNMEFSIDEIKQIFAGAKEEALLIKKRTALLRQAADISKKIACIEGYLSEDILRSDYRVIMKSLPEVIVAYMDVHLSGYEDLFYKMPDMGAEMEKAGCECKEPGYCYTIYHADRYQEADVDAEICEEVTQLKDDTQSLKFKVVPPVEQAACVLHKGPYENLPQAYAAIVRYLDESGYEIAGLPREVYIDGIWNMECEDDWLTEIQFPLKKAEI